MQKDAMFIGVLMVSILFGGCGFQQETTAPLPYDAKKAPSVPRLRLRQPFSRYRSCWAVVIGIDSYDLQVSGWKPLKHAANDARAVAHVLQEQFGYSTVHEHGKPTTSNVLLLTDEEATQSAIRNSFDNWLHGTHESLPGDHLLNEDDAVLVFFAGHGDIDRKADGRPGFIAAVDSEKSRLADTSISIAWLLERLRGLPCRHKAIILGSCYSGALFRTGDGQQPSLAIPGQQQPADVSSTPPRTLGIQVENDAAFWGMSAAEDTPALDDGDGGHSVFTSALLKELEERCSSERIGERFTFRELAERVRTQMTKNPNFGERPELGRLEEKGKRIGRGDFHFIPTVDAITPRERAALDKDRAVKEEYYNKIRETAEGIARKDVRTARRLLNECPLSQRNWEWNYLWHTANPEIARLTASDGNSQSIAISKDGTNVAVASSRGAVRCIELPSRRSRRFENRTRVTALEWVDSGRELVIGDTDGNVVSWTLRDSVERVSLADLGSEVSCIDLNETAKLLAVGLADGGLHVLPMGKTRSSEKERRLAGHSRRVESVSFISNDTLVSMDQGGTIALWELGSGEIIRKLHAPGPILHMATSDDGRRIAVCTGEKVVIWEVANPSRLAEIPSGAERVWFTSQNKSLLVKQGSAFSVIDIGTGREQFVLIGSEGRILSAAKSANGVFLAAIDEHRDLRIWKIEDPARRAFEVPGEILAVKDDGTQTLIRTSDRMAVLLRNGSSDDAAGISETFPTSSRITAADFAASGELIAIGTEDGNTKIISISKKSEQHEVGSISEPITSCSFSPDSTVLATGIDSGIIQVWDVATGTRRCLLREDGRTIQRLKFSHDGKLLAAVLSELLLAPPKISVWRVADWSLQNDLVVPVSDPPTRDKILDFAISPDSSSVVAAFGRGGALRWRLDAGEPQVQRWSTRETQTIEFLNMNRAVSSGKDTAILDVASGRVVLELPEAAARVRTAQNGEDVVFELSRVITRRQAPHPVEYYSIPKPANDVACFDAKLAVVDVPASYGRKGVVLEDPFHGSSTRLGEQDSLVACVATISGGRALVMGTEDGAISKWDPTTNSSILVHPPGMNEVITLSTDHEGTLLAAIFSDGIVKVFDTARGKLLREFSSQQYLAARPFRSVAGNSLALADKHGALHIWTGTSFSEHRILKASGSSILSLCVDGTGAFLVTGSEEGTIEVWNILEQRCIRSTNLHSSSVRSIAICPQPNSDLAASVDWDFRLSLWKLTTGEIVGHYSGPAGGCRRLLFTPDSKHLVVASDQDGVRILDYNALLRKSH